MKNDLSSALISAQHSYKSDVVGVKLFSYVENWIQFVRRALGFDSENKSGFTICPLITVK